MPKEKFSFHALEQNDNNFTQKISTFFSTTFFSKQKTVFCHEALVKNFFPSVFYLARSHQKQNQKINWKKLFIDSILKVTNSFTESLRVPLKSLITTAVQGDCYNFERLLKELPFEIFFHPNLSIEDWLKVITRSEKPILDILYNYIKANYNNNLFPKIPCWSLLDWAIVCRQTEEVAKLATEENIKILYNSEDKFLNHFILTQKNAVTYSDTDTVEILNEKIKGFLSVRKLGSPTPLWNACLNDNLEMISFLISKDQDPDESTKDYSTITARLARDEHHIAAFNALLEHNIDINVKHVLNNNLSLVALAATVGAVTTVELILEHYQLNIPNEDLEHALVLAVTNGSYETTEVLLSAGVNPNVPNFQKKLEQQQSSPKSRLNSLPIVKATTNNNLEIFKLLIKYGAELSNNLLTTIPWFSKFHNLTQGTVKEAVVEIEKIFAEEDNQSIDNRFFYKWLHDVKTMPVTTWEELFQTMNNAVKNAEKHSIPLSKHYLSQFKQAMTYIEIKTQIEKNKTAEFSMSLSNDNFMHL